MVGRKFLDQVIRQAAAFRAEDENVACRKRRRIVSPTALGGQREHAATGERGLAGSPVGVSYDAGELVIIEAGPFQFPIIPAKAHGFDKMEFCTGIGAETDHVAGVGGDFGLVENDGEHLSGLEKGRKKKRYFKKLG